MKILYKKRNTLNIGDEVAFAPTGAYAGISIGIIEKFTPKQVGIKRKNGGVGRHMSAYEDKLYYAISKEILKI